MTSLMLRLSLALVCLGKAAALMPTPASAVHTRSRSSVQRARSLVAQVYAQPNSYTVVNQYGQGYGNRQNQMGDGMYGGYGSYGGNNEGYNRQNQMGGGYGGYSQQNYNHGGYGNQCGKEGPSKQSQGQVKGIALDQFFNLEI